MQKIIEFARAHRFALVTAGLWLATVWGLVLVAQLFFHQPLSLAAWGGSWDGAWYRSIVEGGYATEPPTAQTNLTFFPLLPLLTSVVAFITHLPVVWCGMLVSTLAFGAALVVLHKLVSAHFGQGTARWTVLLVAFNPFSFYFGMLYTEALFLLLAVSAFWFIYRKQWWQAAICAGLATATRSVGVALSVAVMLAWLLEVGAARPWRPNRLLSLVPQAIGLGLVSIAGLLIFSTYLYFHTGDALAPQHAQAFWPGRGGLPNVLRELSYLWAHERINMEYVLTLVWYLSAAVAFGGLWLLIRARQVVMTVYAAIALSLPILFGTAASMNRYSQVVVPIFIAYAGVLQTQPKWLKMTVLALCICGLAAAIFLIIDPRSIFVG